ncbi:hypothetical protein DAI22_12g113100 [Oryza sativa Japonica Group]|nr:hypothetical protein DAI22_12g113100 [Oryza sativa Japonica Group]
MDRNLCRYESNRYHWNERHQEFRAPCIRFVAHEIKWLLTLQVEDVSRPLLESKTDTRCWWRIHASERLEHAA